MHTGEQHTPVVFYQAFVNYRRRIRVPFRPEPAPDFLLILFRRLLVLGQYIGRRHQRQVRKPLFLFQIHSIQHVSIHLIRFGKIIFLLLQDDSIELPTVYFELRILLRSGQYADLVHHIHPFGILICFDEALHETIQRFRVVGDGQELVEIMGNRLFIISSRRLIVGQTQMIMGIRMLRVQFDGLTKIATSIHAVFPSFTEIIGEGQSYIILDIGIIRRQFVGALESGAGIIAAFGHT